MGVSTCRSCDSPTALGSTCGSCFGKMHRATRREVLDEVERAFYDDYNDEATPATNIRRILARLRDKPGGTL